MYTEMGIHVAFYVRGYVIGIGLDKYKWDEVCKQWVPFYSYSYNLPEDIPPANCLLTTSVSSGIRQGWNKFFLGPDTSCYGQWHILEGTYPVPSHIFLKLQPGTLF